MNKQIHIQTYRDGELDPDYLPSPLTKLLEALTGWVGQLGGYIKLQARMALYDAIHGTHYRQTRNRLIRQERNRAFMDSIGLVPLKG